MTRVATCQCRQLRADAAGDPVLVNICHCGHCRRRTGAAFAYNVYFTRDAVTITGTHRQFERDGKEGRKVRQHFCPTCATTLFWDLDLAPDLLGLAGGAFDDPTLPGPSYSIWEEAKYQWLPLPDDIEHWPQRRNA